METRSPHFQFSPFAKLVCAHLIIYYLQTLDVGVDFFVFKEIKLERMLFNVSRNEAKQKRGKKRKARCNNKLGLARAVSSLNQDVDFPPIL